MSINATLTNVAADYHLVSRVAVNGSPLRNEFKFETMENTVPVKIVSVERNNATSPEGKFLALREDGEDFEEDTFILQVNSCSQS